MRQTLFSKTLLKRTATVMAAILFYETVAIPLAQAAVIAPPAPRTPSSLSIFNSQRAQLAAKDFHEKFSVPVSVGTLAESYAPSTAARLIYHFQDVHNHVPAQTNLSEMISLLEAFARKQGKNLVVAVEGVSGPVDSDAIARLPNQKNKEDVGSALLRAGYLMGEEYAAITNEPGRIKLVGIETPSYYQRNVAARASSRDARLNILTAIKETRSQLEKLKRHNFSVLLTTLEEKRLGVDAGTVSLTDYATFLANTNPTVVAAHPQLSRLTHVNVLEKSVDFAAVEKESQSLVAELTLGNNNDRVEKMMRDADALKNGQLSALSYYSGLLQQTRKSYPTLENYVAYLRAADGIDADRLFDEVMAAESEIAHKLIRHPLAQQLYDHLRWIENAEKFFSLNLIPQEWAQEKLTTAGSVETRLADIRSFINEQQMDLGYRFAEPAVNPAELSQAVTGARGFYEAASNRNAVMLGNLERVLEENPANKSVVAFITGGFHTPEMTKMLRAKGLAYEVFRPQLETEVELSQDLTIRSRKVDYLRKPQLEAELGVAPLVGPINEPSIEKIKKLEEELNALDAKKDEPSVGEGNTGTEKSAPSTADQAKKLLEDLGDPTHLKSLGFVAGAMFTLSFLAATAIFHFIGNAGAGLARKTFSEFRQSAILSKQLRARDQYYLDFANKTVASQEFQAFVGETYPDLVAANDLHRLPEILQRWFDVAHDSKRPEQERIVAAKSFQQVIELTTSLRNLPNPADTRAKQVSFDTPLVDVRDLTEQADFPRTEGIQELPDSNNVPFASAPIDGYGNPLPRGKLKQEIRTAMKEVVDRELAGDVVIRISMGGNARRFNLMGEFPAAMLTAQIALEKIKDRLGLKGKTQPTPRMPFFVNVPVFSRFIVSRLSYIMKMALEKQVDPKKSLDQQRFWLEVSQKNSDPIIDYLVQNKFFGLPRNNFIFTEQESAPGYWMNNGFFKRLSRLQALVWQLLGKKLEVGSQGHGAMEDRGRLPNAAFTVEVDAAGNIQRHYFSKSMYEMLAAEKETIVSHFQLSMNHAVNPGYWEDTSHHAIGFAGQKLGLHVTQFRLDPTTIKGGILAKLPNVPGYQILEPSVLKGPRGEQLIAAAVKYREQKGFKMGVVNAGVVVIDPKSMVRQLADKPYHSPILTVRGVAGTEQGSPALLNPMMHLDLWRYELANQVPNILYLTTWPRFEAKSQDGLSEHVDFLNEAEDPVKYPINFKALEDLRQGREPFQTLEYYAQPFTQPISAREPLIGGLVFFVPAILSLVYGHSSNLGTAFLWIAAVAGLISVIVSAILAIATVLAPRVDEGMTLGTLIDNPKHFAGLKLDAKLIESARKFAVANGLDIYEVEIKNNVLGHVIDDVGNNKKQLTIGIAILRSATLQKLVLLHEQVHLRQPISNRRSSVLWLKNEIAAWTKGSVAFLGSLNQSSDQSENSAEPFSTRTIPAATAAEGKKTTEFATKLGSLLAKYDDKRLKSPQNVIGAMTGWSSEPNQSATDTNGFAQVVNALAAVKPFADGNDKIGVVLSDPETDPQKLANAQAAASRLNALQQENVPGGIDLMVSKVGGVDVQIILEGVQQRRENIVPENTVVVGIQNSGFDDKVFVNAGDPVEMAVRSFIAGRYSKNVIDQLTPALVNLIKKTFPELETGHFTDRVITEMVAAIMA